MPRARQVRRAEHAGSWYTDDGDDLSRELDEYLSRATTTPDGHPCAIIAPHAGYRFSGPCAAYAYKQIDPTKVERVFILGPSHHVFLRTCALSEAGAYSTPIGDVPIDQDVYQELHATGEFETMSLDVDEAEHSLEMHMPYVIKSMGSKSFKIVPIMVGALNADAEAHYGRVLAPYLADPSNFFVASSDFCHWGKRFNYTLYDASRGPIHQFIEELDRAGMEVIETREPRKFTEYLAKFENTICGRHPIGVLLNMLEASGREHKVKFTRYEQSSRCMDTQDSSVSYASAIVVPQ
mmetsp:Transcript_46447/g.148999  ORF Transcript_46447/g.148999 Transcript_46447/m.148999 type:complete len:294 (-) Transcript_46447:371-1252(-)|eukprot:CAMPEP_0182912230 /NCGR_PEP_ID=MMETSP0034_2-20130328/37401_1 /TAXON_ID=156128 /ORGANISM="Nephroselmis pyriformis, Strain CCMP717" /LENGTH=293 /DNA_ID=CAMNT_0025048889 /DNA_START=130 /DNA_END=1011 /DNA_ORIENTATION=-